jgi:hypothetical protein
MQNFDEQSQSAVAESESQIDQSEMDDDSFAEAIAKNIDYETFP